MSSLSAAAIKMASSSTNASTASSEQTSSAVQPSAAFISALHHKLCDPSIVPEFELCRSPHVTQRLITPRWVLLNCNTAEKVDVADGADDCDKAAGSSKDGSAQKISNDSPPTSHNHHYNNGQTTNNNNNEHKKFNTVPKRNYLDIRIEQNTIFANEQCLRCQKKLAALSSTSPKSVEAINVNKKQIQKVIDSIQNHLNEGLAACPNHDGLLQVVEPELKLWLDRINGVVVVNNNGSSDTSPSAGLVDTATATMSEGRGANNTTDILPKTNTQQQTTTVKRKGAEGRAQAAMDDALVEKMFLQGGDEKNDGHSNNTDAVVDTNNLEDLKCIPPVAPRVNDDDDDERRSAQHYRRREYPSDDYSDNSDRGRKRSSSSSRHNQRRIRHHRSKSRSRSKSAERGGEDRRRRRSKKRRHRDRRRDDDDSRKHRKKRRYRSRSRSLSRGSCSSSLASRSPISSRDRSKRRKHHRKDRHHSSSSHKRRHKSRRGSSRRKERKSSKRHRSRRDRSRSVSSSPSFSAVGPDDDGGGVEGRFEPPLSPPVQHKTEELSVQREDSIEKRFVPPSNNKASDEIIMQSEVAASMRQTLEEQVREESCSKKQLSFIIPPKKSNGASDQKQSDMQQRFVPKKGKEGENVRG